MTRTDPRSAAVTVELPPTRGPISSPHGTGWSPRPRAPMSRSCRSGRGSGPARGSVPPTCSRGATGALTGGAQVMLRRVPGLGQIGYVSYGPVLAATGTSGPTPCGSWPPAWRGCPGSACCSCSRRRAPTTSGRRCWRAGSGRRPPASPRSARCGWTSTAVTTTSASGFPPRLRSWTRRWPDPGVTVRIGDADDIPVLARAAALGRREPGLRATGTAGVPAAHVRRARRAPGTPPCSSARCTASR